MSALAALLLRDPEYAALYNDTMDKLRAAETATEIALAKARSSLVGAKDELATLLDTANTLEDGTRVFRAADGNVYAEDGRLIEEEELEGILWHDDASSYEDLLNRKKDADEAQASYDVILRYQTDVLGHARDRLADEDDPPSKDELEQIQRLIDEQQPRAVKAEAEPTSAADGHAPGASFSNQLPKL